VHEHRKGTTSAFTSAHGHAVHGRERRRHSHQHMATQCMSMRFDHDHRIGVHSRVEDQFMAVRGACRACHASTDSGWMHWLKCVCDAPTSCRHAPTSCRHAPTSCRHAPTSCRHAPTSCRNAKTMQHCMSVTRSRVSVHRTLRATTNKAARDATIITVTVMYNRGGISSRPPRPVQGADIAPYHVCLPMVVLPSPAV
jgi:hypothetical protein